MARQRVAPADEFQTLDLRCHTLLRDVPIHDAWVIDLPGGGPARTLRDVFAVAGWDRAARGSLAVRALLALRFALGRLLGWDRSRHDPLAESYLHRLTEDDRARSVVPPGTPRGPFRTLYVFADEALLEVHNATVHAFLAMALRARDSGYTLYWGVYVKPVGRLTGLYMALIDPFRRLIVYPALIRETRAAWSRAHA